MASFSAKCLLLMSLMLTSATAATFPPTTYREHPIYTLKQFSGKTMPKPVIVRKYYSYHERLSRTRHFLFVPGVGSIMEYPAWTQYGENLDVLITPGFLGFERGTFLEVHLNGPTRVIVVLVGRGIGRSDFKESFPSVTGLPSGWKATTAAQTNRTIVGDTKERHGEKYNLPLFGLALEKNFDGSSPILLPDPGFIKVNGKPGARYTLFFAKPDRKLASPPMPLPYPSSPKRVWNLVTNELVDTTGNPAKPNVDCPPWLHDLYVTPSRTGSDAARSGEPRYWRTWHGLIDPVYWCYFRHEHGAYPGPSYRPMLGYTAWKTPDESEPTGRQDESHNGFKLFAFPVKNDPMDRVAIITVHMHLSMARRFKERTHTMIFTILKPAGKKHWRVVVELHMKADFGAGMVTLANGTSIPASPKDEKIHQDNVAISKLLRRRFNVLDLSNFPSSVDKSFAIIGDLKHGMSAISHGVYERWGGNINTCIKEHTDRRFTRGLDFDVRDPGSAMKAPIGTTDRTLQWLSGYSLRKVLTIHRATTFDFKLCELEEFNNGTILSSTDGVFYTDPYFTKVVPGPGKNAVRQYILPGLRPVKFPIGRIFPCEKWVSGMCYHHVDEDYVIKFENIENAIDRTKN